MAQGGFGTKVVLDEYTHICLCKSSCARWCLFPPPGAERVRFPMEQPGWSSSHMHHEKRQQLVLHLGCRRRKVCLIARIRTCWRSERRGGRGKKKRRRKKSFKWQDWAYSIWPACAIQALGGSRSTCERLRLGGSSREEKRHCRMEDSQTPANRRALQVHGARLTVRCHPAANSAWSPGRANAWTMRGTNLFFHLS